MIDFLKHWTTLLLIFPMVIFIGGYLSVRLKFLQVTKLARAFHLVTTKEKKDSISSFGALSAVLGGNLGTGNISGVAVAIAAGGPGALFWMWVMSILASVLKYTSCFLGVHFQIRDQHGQWIGGPMYYIAQGLNTKWLAVLFCVFTISSSLTVGNLVQVQALVLPLSEFHIDPLLPCLMLVLLVGGVIFGSLKRFSHFVSFVVPFMAFAYVTACLVILYHQRHDVGYYLTQIMERAFELKPLAAGAAGYTIFATIRSGFDRGLFATDSGLGLEAILHASVVSDKKGEDNRVTQGLISVLSPMIVMVICTLTGLVLLTTEANHLHDYSSTRTCIEAFRIGFQAPWAGHIVSITLFFFAFTTMLTWCFCATRAVEFLWGPKVIPIFLVVFVGIIPLGAFFHESIIWTVADFSNNFMFIINVVAIICLRKIYLSTKPS